MILKGIVKKISATDNYLLERKTEKRIIYRPSTNAVSYSTNKASFMDSKLHPNDQHYIVNNDDLETIEGNCEVFSKNDNYEIKIRIIGNMGCLPGKEIRFLQMVLNSKSNDNILDYLFNKWTGAFTEGKRLSTRESFTEIRTQLRSHYERYARTKGIRLVITNIIMDDRDSEFENFSFTTDKDSHGYSEDTYQTNTSDVEVKLSVVVHAGGNSPADIPDVYRRKDVPIVSLIKVQTIECIRKWMREISPEEIYMEDKDKKIDELKKVLQRFYQSEFNINNPHFNIYSLDTKFIDRLKSLMSEEGSLFVKNPIEDIKYDIIYKIKGVSDWNRFKLHQNKYYGNHIEEYADINKLLKNNIENFLNGTDDITYNELRDGSIDRVISSLFLRTSEEIVETEYGIILGTPRIRRYAINGEGRGGNGREGNGNLKLKLEAYERKRISLNEDLDEAIFDEEEDLVIIIEEKINQLEEKNRKIQLQISGNSNLKYLTNEKKNKLE
jgi:hypothetical protein